jgi:hypothetical protein
MRPLRALTLTVFAFTATSLACGGPSGPVTVPTAVARTDGRASGEDAATFADAGEERPVQDASARADEAADIGAAEIGSDNQDAGGPPDGAAVMDAPLADAQGDAASPADTAAPPPDAPPDRPPDVVVSAPDAGPDGPDAAAAANIQTVFIVLEENRDWDQVKGLPYIRHLTEIGAHSEQYFNPRRNHPSEPNYIWLEAGSNFGIEDDEPPETNVIHDVPHLTRLLDAAGISWMSYQEDMEPGTCPIEDLDLFGTRHDPFVFFDDVAGSPPSKNNPYCVAHHRPFSVFLDDLKAGRVARYNFITPNVDNDMHNGTSEQGDDWLRENIDPIINPDDPHHNAAIFARAALIVTFDEGNDDTGSDGPLGMIVVSPFARPGFQDTSAPRPYFYTHSSTLLTLQKIFGVADTPLGAAARARDLAALFTVFP